MGTANHDTIPIVKLHVSKPDRCCHACGEILADRWRLDPACPCPYCGEPEVPKVSVFRWQTDSQGAPARLARNADVAPPVPTRRLKRSRKRRDAAELLRRSFEGFSQQRSAAFLRKVGKSTPLAKRPVTAPPQRSVLRIVGLLAATVGLAVCGVAMLAQVKEESAKPSAAVAPTITKADKLAILETWQAFLNAPNSEALLPLLRESERVGPLLTSYYQYHPVRPGGIPQTPPQFDQCQFRLEENGGETVYRLHYSTTDDRVIEASFVRERGAVFQLDWEAFVAHGDLSVREFLASEPDTLSLLRLRASIVERGTSLWQLHVGDRERWHGIAYLPVDRLRFSEILDHETDQPLFLTVQARFRKLAGHRKPVAVIETLVRPSWYAPKL